ncbi:MAG TPA: hypothetical protein VI455_07180 [Terriglobia bacterium]
MSTAGNEGHHERARRLIDMERVEGLSAADQKWLKAHLGDCEACANWASSTNAAVRAVVTVSVAVPSGLASATKFRVRQQARELNQRRMRNTGLVVGCALSWVVGVASAPLVWRVCEWLGSEVHLPRVVWMIGFVSWWLVPAAAAAALLLWQRERAERESTDRPLGVGFGRDSKF